MTRSISPSLGRQQSRRSPPSLFGRDARWLPLVETGARAGGARFSVVEEPTVPPSAGQRPESAAASPSGLRRVLHDLGIRAAGGVLLAFAGLSFWWLGRSFDAPGARPGAIAFLAALLGFLAASGGSTLLLLGRHVLDRIAISDQWRPGR